VATLTGWPTLGQERISGLSGFSGVQQVRSTGTVVLLVVSAGVAVEGSHKPQEGVHEPQASVKEFVTGPDASDMGLSNGTPQWFCGYGKGRPRVKS
jgi:hypothetical protein